MSSQPVTLVVNVGGVADPTATITLVCPDGSTTSPCPTPSSSINPITSRTLVTSAYPGQCTNFDNPGGLAAAPDFTFDPVAKVLTPTDREGIGVIQVTVTSNAALNGTYTFILPQDTDFAGRVRRATVTMR